MSTEVSKPEPEPSAQEQPVGESTITFHDVTLKFRPGRYRVKEFHARGGMGEVYRGEDCEIGREIALKTLSEGREHQHHRFLQEAQITGQLEHPGIVPLHDVGVDEDGRPFYVMKFVHGRRLKDAVAEYHLDAPSPDTPREVQQLRLLSVFVDLCQTMAYAHSRGVIHRDLKPDNVMIGPFGETIVLDWGLAKVRGQPDSVVGTSDYVHVSHSGGSSDTVAGAVIGAPPYMSPEMAEGKAAAADERTDVFLLGATLYEILTGNPPRRGSSKNEIIELARTALPLAPRKVKPEIPRLLESICLKAMARRPQDRYPSATALAEDVQRYLAGEPVSSYQEGALARAGRWVMRHRRGLARMAAAAVLVAIVAGGAIVVRDAQRETQAARSEADRAARVEQARGELERFRKLADEAHYVAAGFEPVGQSAPYYDLRRGQQVAADALNLADAWGTDLQNLPLVEEHQSVKQQLYELLLLAAQIELYRQPDADSRKVEQIEQLLNRAAALQEPTRSLHRLRARCHQMIGEDELAVKAQKAAEDPALPGTAMDHFWQGEAYRTSSDGVSQDLFDRLERLAQALGRAGRSLGPPPPDERLARAIEEYQQAIIKDNNHYWARYQLGRCYLSQGQGYKALAALDGCMAIRPEAPWAYALRGVALVLQRQPQKAEQELSKTVKRFPGFQSARLNLGLARYAQKKHNEALDDFAAVLASPAEQRLIEAAFYRGQVYLDRARDRKSAADLRLALQEFADVLSERPDFLLAYLARVQTHIALRQASLVTGELNLFLDQAAEKKIEHDSAEACHLRGFLLRRLASNPDGWTLARNELEQAVRLERRVPQLFDDLGAVLMLLKKPEEAIAAYTQGLALAPEHVQLRIKRGWATAEQQKTRAQAHADFATAVRSEPHNAEAHVGLGYVLALDKSAELAQAEAALALMNQNNDRILLRYVACVYARLSEWDEKQRKQHQDVAMTLLRKGVDLWRASGGLGPNEIGAIRGERSFDSLHDRPDYKQLVGPP